MVVRDKNRYSIIKIDKIDQVLNFQGGIFLFDIEQTILKDNRFFSAISKKYKHSHEKNYFSILLTNLCKSANIKASQYDNILSYGKHYKREVVEESVKHVIKTLKSRGNKIYALTSGFQNMDKFLKMEREHGIVFDHVICTSRGPKGPALWQHLTQFNIQDKCVFIDNHEIKLCNVGETFAINNRLDQITLLHYTFNDKYVAPEKKEFLNYWTDVIRDYQSNEIKD